MEGNLRSGPSIVPIFMRFVNRTYRSISVIWINYEGYSRPYKILKPYEFFDVNSFEGHPWICEDSETGDRLLLNNSEVLMPKGEGDNFTPARQVVLVTIPVFRLDVRCVQVIKQRIQSKTDVFRLNIPFSLQKALIECFLKRDVGI